MKKVSSTIGWGNKVVGGGDYRRIPISFKVSAKSTHDSPLGLYTVLEPLRHMSDARRTRNDIFIRMRRRTSSYLSFVFVDNFSARILWYRVASGPITPLTVNIIGVNVPCSTSIILVLYFLFFFNSCDRSTDFMDVSSWLAQSALVTHMSKNACCPSQPHH